MHITLCILLDFISRVPRTTVDHGVERSVVECYINRATGNGRHVANVCAYPLYSVVCILSHHEVDDDG